MQKKLIVAALAGLAAAPAFAQSNVTVYGRINTSIESESQSGSRNANVVRDNGSRLGFRGTEDLGNGLKAVFGVETGVNADAAGSTAGNSGSFGLGRHAYVGLDSGAGTLVAGRLDANAGSGGGAPAYTAFGAIWNDVNQDNGTTGLTQSAGVGTFGSAGVASRAVFGIRTRSDNSIGYASPTIAGGLKVYARYAMLGTNNGVEVANGTVTGLEQDTKEIEVAAVYKAGPLAVSGAYTTASYKDSGAANRFDNRWQLGGAYDLGVAKLGAVYAKTNYEAVTGTNQSDAKEYGVSAKVPFGKNEIVANYARRELATKADGDDRTWQVGYGYNFSARTRGYVFYQNRDFDTSASGTQGSAGNDPIKTLGVGLRHNF